MEVGQLRLWCTNCQAGGKGRLSAHLHDWIWCQCCAWICWLPAGVLSRDVGKCFPNLRMLDLLGSLFSTLVCWLPKMLTRVVAIHQSCDPHICVALCVFLCPLFLNLICIYVICVILCVHTVLPSPKTWSAQCLRKIIHSWSVWTIQFAGFCILFLNQVLVSPRLFGRDLLHWWWRHRVWQRGKCKANGAWICASRHGRSLG